MYLWIFSAHITVWALPSLEVGLLIADVFLVFSLELDNLSTQKSSNGEGVEERELSCTVDGNANWYSHYGEQYGDSLKS